MAGQFERALQSGSGLQCVGGLVVRALHCSMRPGVFVCGISLVSANSSMSFFQTASRSCFSQVVLRHRGGYRIYEMRCLFVAVGLNALFIVRPHWDNMS